MSVHVVWFKRDLRVHDHAPLFHAAQQDAPVLPLYIVEPSFLQAPDFDGAHWAFIGDSLRELRDRLAVLGQPLIIRVGEAVPVWRSLAKQIQIERIWAHEETTNLQGYARDRAVRQWANAAGIPLSELPRNGVVRRLQSREDWEGVREKRMRQPVLPVPEAIRPVSLVTGRIPDHQQLRLRRPRRQVQSGGSANGHDLLRSFLHERGADYVTAMSSPITAVEACSRLSPHLAYGTLSGREAVQAVRQRLIELRGMDPDEREKLGGRWIGSLRAFESRLAWRDHFMQKIEMQPDLETQNLVRSYDGLRSDGSARLAKERLEAWQKGETGYSMVDACMRSLDVTGWLNFRMRSMLVSFAAHDLWLHWRAFADHLARAFVDYEPGIHYCQLQMQSGTSGNRTLRIYDPIKQGVDYDPDGSFIRRWVPELSDVPNSFIHAPHLMPPTMQQKFGCQIGRDYPQPLVDHAKAAAAARQRIAAVRHDPIAEEERLEVISKHGRRRSAALAKKKKPPKEEDGRQLKLF
ncbi:MAG: deoxyribodipyrimidine photo-lyase [Ardenticatenaceae bacterium]|nr:deoxyribodipyrimidine photo-lyase [Ardenticatenaceae bacterium]